LEDTTLVVGGAALGLIKMENMWMVRESMGYVQPHVRATSVMFPIFYNSKQYTSIYSEETDCNFETEMNKST
jgi:hypothetical protein